MTPVKAAYLRHLRAAHRVNFWGVLHAAMCLPQHAISQRTDTVEPGLRGARWSSTGRQIQ